MDKSLAKEAELLEELIAHLESGKMAKSYVTDDEDKQAILKSLNLLTYKPTIYAANVAEDDLAVTAQAMQACRRYVNLQRKTEVKYS